MPNSQRMNRGGHTVNEIVDMCRGEGYSDLVVVQEHRGVLAAHCSLAPSQPPGPPPTAHRSRQPTRSPHAAHTPLTREPRAAGAGWAGGVPHAVRAHGLLRPAQRRDAARHPGPRHRDPARHTCPGSQPPGSQPPDMQPLGSQPLGSQPLGSQPPGLQPANPFGHPAAPEARPRAQGGPGPRGELSPRGYLRGAAVARWRVPKVADFRRRRPCRCPRPTRISCSTT